MLAVPYNEALKVSIENNPALTKQDSLLLEVFSQQKVMNKHNSTANLKLADASLVIHNEDYESSIFVDDSILLESQII